MMSFSLNANANFNVSCNLFAMSPYYSGNIGIYAFISFAIEMLTQLSDLMLTLYVVVAERLRQWTTNP